MSARGSAYMDVTPLSRPQTDQPMHVSQDHKGCYGYGYRVEIIGDLFVLRFEQVTGEREQGDSDQRAGRPIGQEGNHWYPGQKTRRH